MVQFGGCRRVVRDVVLGGFIEPLDEGEDAVGLGVAGVGVAADG